MFCAVVVVLAILLAILVSSASATTTNTNFTGDPTLIPSTTDNSITDLSTTIEGLFGMSKLNASQIKEYAMQAGFSGTGLNIAVAVALAESGGNTQAYNPETAAHTPEGLGSYGLWQIYLKVHPEYTGVDLKDPLNNANAAFDISNGGLNWSPWSTFKNNAYLSHMSDAINA